MKCPKCGATTPWDTLTCDCGYDYEKQAKTISKAEASSPVRQPVPRSAIWKLAMSLIWVFLVLGFTAGAIKLLFFVSVVSSIGVNDGANRTPFLLLILSPVAAVLLVIGGLWFILTRSKPGNHATPNFLDTKPQSGVIYTQSELDAMNSRRGP